MPITGSFYKCVCEGGRGGGGRKLFMTALFDILYFDILYYLFLIFSHCATQNKKEKSCAKNSWTGGKRKGLLCASASSTAALKTSVTDPMAQVSEAITNILL